MDIQLINSTLTKAIESLQTNELEILWEFTVPSPHEMHRKYGMKLSKGMLKVPSPEDLAPLKPKRKRKKKEPEQPGEIDQVEALAKSAKTDEQLERLFDKLKPGMIVWAHWKSFAMGTMGREFIPFRIGRKSHSKRYATTTIKLMRPDQKKALSPGWQIKLLKRKDGTVSIAEGDMATMNPKIYVP